MPRTKTPRAPSHLSREMKAWWKQVNANYFLEEHHRMLLRLCCESFDRTAEARAAIIEHGMYFSDRFGQPRQHPAVGIERASAAAFQRLARELGLDTDDLPEQPRLPRQGSRRNER